MVSLSKICFSPHIISICPWFYHIQTKNNKLKKHNLASKQRKRKKIDNFMISHSMFWNHSIEIKKKKKKVWKLKLCSLTKQKIWLKIVSKAIQDSLTPAFEPIHPFLYWIFYLSFHCIQLVLCDALSPLHFWVLPP